jgi:hypothetical protein
MVKDKKAMDRLIAQDADLIDVPAMTDVEKTLTAGAYRAFVKFTHKWQTPGKDTFNFSGAQEAVRQRPDLCEYSAIRIGRQQYSRPHYRLKEV